MKVYESCCILQGMKIVAATCSTKNGKEYVFESEVDPSTNVWVYRCHCKGTSTLFNQNAKSVSCIIYYWLCPEIS